MYRTASWPLGSCLSPTVFVSPQAAILRTLISSAQSCTKSQQHHRLGGCIMIQGIQENLQVSAEVDLVLLDDLEHLFKSGLISWPCTSRTRSCRICMLLSLRFLEPIPLLPIHLSGLFRAREIRISTFQFPREPASVCGKECACLHQLRMNLETLLATSLWQRLGCLLLVTCCW